MYQKTYFMPKPTGTFADTLAAFGLAVVLREVYEQANGRGSGKKIRICDAGPYYEIELPTGLRQEWVEKCTFFMPARPIHTAKQPVKEITDAWDLDAEWERARAFFDAQKTLKKTAKGESDANSQLQAQLEDLRPSPEFWTMAFVGDWRMQALSIYNAAILQWHDTRDHVIENLKTILKLAATPAADFDAIAKEWGKSLPKDNGRAKFIASQLFNPSQGKGQNRAKADALAMDNLKSFWLMEFLKAAGLWYCMTPRSVRNGDDRKVYVLSPITLSLGAHDKVFQDFASRLWNDTAVKMDISVALLYTETLLKYSQAAGEDDELDFEKTGPENVVAGFHTATYKLLSRNAFTMMHLGFIGLPHWTGEVKTRERVTELIDVIKEHLDVVRNIDEERSDGYNLLVLYRDFLSGGQLETFFDFAISYSQYLTHELDQKQFRVKKFTTTNLRRLFMGINPQLMEILENEGFRNIAYAIRRSTVIPQYLKQKGDTLYDVRYGLGMELKRKAAYPKEFVAALSSFIQEYNQENVQKLESKNQQRRKNIRTNDLDDIVRLVDKFGSELICNLLVAYGYAGDPSEEAETV
ncbi:MAG: hypothetical protein ACUVRJ_05410 [Candidatus Villigracilaceae bacterium]